MRLATHWLAWQSQPCNGFVWVTRSKRNCRHGSIRSLRAVSGAAPATQPTTQMEPICMTDLTNDLRLYAVTRNDAHLRSAWRRFTHVLALCDTLFWCWRQPKYSIQHARRAGHTLACMAKSAMQWLLLGNPVEAKSPAWLDSLYARCIWRIACHVSHHDNHALPGDSLRR